MLCLNREIYDIVVKDMRKAGRSECRSWNKEIEQ